MLSPDCRGISTASEPPGSRTQAPRGPLVPACSAAVGVSWPLGKGTFTSDVGSPPDIGAIKRPPCISGSRQKPAKAMRSPSGDHIGAPAPAHSGCQGVAVELPAMTRNIGPGALPVPGRWNAMSPRLETENGPALSNTFRDAPPN